MTLPDIDTMLKNLSGYVLSKEEILERIRSSKPLVTGFINLPEQLQPAGFELTVAEVGSLKNQGTIDFSNTNRRLPDVEPVGLDENSPKLIPPGTYIIRYNEAVHLPNDLLALIFPRSSLMRSGATIYTAVWDPGYEGRGQGLLCVFNKHGLNLYRNARVGQMIFLKLRKGVAEGYRGAYQKEGLTQKR